MGSSQILFDSIAISKAIERLAGQILERHFNLTPLAFVGLPRRGFTVAQRLANSIAKHKGVIIPVGQMDVTFHRDDLDQRCPAPALSQIPFDATDRTILLVDDVLFTGRTARAALSALNDFGRAARIELVTLIDRGHRQLPIQPDYVGETIVTTFQDQVAVHLQEIDGRDEVDLIEG